MLKDGPEVRPYSAEAFEVSILTSWMKSGPTLFISEPLDPATWLYAPSTVRLPVSDRLPLIVWFGRSKRCGYGENVGIGDHGSRHKSEQLSVVAAIECQVVDLLRVDYSSEFS